MPYLWLSSLFSVFSITRWIFQKHNIFVIFYCLMYCVCYILCLLYPVDIILLSCEIFSGSYVSKMCVNWHKLLSMFNNYSSITTIQPSCTKVRIKHEWTEVRDAWRYWDIYRNVFVILYVIVTAEIVKNDVEQPC